MAIPVSKSSSVHQSNRLIGSGEGANVTFDLVKSVARAILYHCPPGAADGAGVPEAAMVAAIPRAGDLIVIHAFLTLAAAIPGVGPVALRTGDFDAETSISGNPLYSDALEAAKMLLYAVSNDRAVSESVLANGKHIITLFFMVAKVRQASVDHHTWYTADAGKPKTVTGKAMKMAAGSEDLVVMCRKDHWAHDSWHFLGQEWHLRAAAKLAGHPLATFPADLVDKTWNMVSVAGRTAKDVFCLSDAIMDRYKDGYGVEGSGSLVNIFTALAIVMDNVAAKMKVGNLVEIKSLTDRMKDQVSKLPTREAVHAVSVALQGPAAYCAGYSSITHQAWYETTPALVTLCGRDPNMSSAGVTFAKLIRERDSTVEGLEAGAAGFFASLSVALTAASAIMADMLPDGLPGRVAPTEVTAGSVAVMLTTKEKKLNAELAALAAGHVADA